MIALRNAARQGWGAEGRWGTLLRRGFALDGALTLLVLGMLALAGIALVGLVADPRILTGAPLWLKPLKFAVSTAIYAGTLLWLLASIPGHPRLVRLVAAGTAWFLAIEIGLVVFQAARGVTSHFNVGDRFDAFIFGRMRDAIIVVATLNLVAIGLLLRQPSPTAHSRRRCAAGWP